MESEAKSVNICPEPHSDSATLSTGWSPHPRSPIAQAMAENDAARQHQALEEQFIWLFGDHNIAPPAKQSPQRRPRKSNPSPRQRAILQILPPSKLPMRHYCMQLDHTQKFPDNWQEQRLPRMSSHLAAWDFKEANGRRSFKDRLKGERTNTWNSFAPGWNRKKG